MKPTTQNILNRINHKGIQDQLNQFKQANPTYEFSEMTVDEALTMYEYNKELLLKAIEKNIVDEQLTVTKRTQINNSLKSIATQLQQLTQYNYNAANQNAAPLAQAVINGVVSLADIVDGCKLQERLTGLADYSAETKEISKTRKAYTGLVADIENATKLNQESKTTHDTLKANADNLLKIAKELEAEKAKAQKLKEEIDGTNENVKKSNQDIEDKKVKIAAFFKNIDDYTKSIAKLETDAKNIIAKEEEINRLISQAERALNLKSAEGISAAFSSYYETAKKAGVVTFFKLPINLWIVGAIIFILAALGLTVWIVSGKWIDHPDSVSSLIGRVVAVAISITGATFCARQYVKQKNIQEDYAYKSVLAKSIIAFTEEIKKRDDKKVVDYLTKVLDEIHRDPLRTRDIKEEKNIGFNAPELVEKLVDILSKGK